MDVETTEEKKKPKFFKRKWPLPTTTTEKITPKKIKQVVVPPKFSMSEEIRDCMEVLKKPACNIEEKLKILEARDKLIRFFRKRNVNKTGATQGTCPDMCPEKERLLRVVQHQVSNYEQDSSKEMNPARAVKQYSRSSADQEAPLPHELRSVSVLQMTMSYLVHKIMSLGDSSEVNVGDWYHFLWDRTRGIRKDITQQELCSKGSVELVEQCARFHIHCSARLVAEEPSVFDQKINTENLTKCLQTLKYMYNDLRLKGEECPNEAEFRAYVILLNLNDGNFMSEVQKLRPEIQKSKEVRTAIEVYSALDKNNFIKFFKLVNATTYLNACILMRYFIQIRIRALNILVKCYVPRITRVVYSLEELTRNLAFESVCHTIEFLQSCGLSMNDSNTGVVLDRSAFAAPDFTYSSQDRAVNVVESKREDLSIGQIICGGMLPPKHFENHIPENSFSDKGNWKIKYLNEKDLAFAMISPKKVADKTEVNSVSSAQKPSSSFITKSPYVYVKDTEESTVKIDKHDKIRKKISSRSNIFSLDNRMKNENCSSRANIFGWQVAKKQPDMMTEVKKVRDGSGRTSEEDKSSFGRTWSENKSIFGNPLTSSESLFVIKNENRLANSIFGGTISTNSLRSLGNEEAEPKKMMRFEEEKIFGMNETISTKETAKDQIDFKEIKWDIDSPEKMEEVPNTLEKFFFEPAKCEAHAVRQNVATTVGGFQFPLVTFPTPSDFKKQNTNLDRKEVSSNAEEVMLEKRRKLREEQRIQLEKEEQIRNLQIERELANVRKKEEERVRKLKEENDARLLEAQKEKEINETVDTLISEVISLVEEKVRNEKITKLKKKIEQRIISNIFYTWHRNAVKVKNKRKAADCSPVWMCSRSPQEEADQLKTESQTLTLKDMRRYKLGKPIDLSIERSYIIDKVDYRELSDVITRRYCELGQKFYKDIYWKCIISLPDSSEMPGCKIWVEETLQQFLKWKEYNNNTLHLEQCKLNPVQSVNYCIQKQNALDIGKCDANGFIFIAQNFNEALCRRILENMKGFGVFVRVPIVIISQEAPPSSLNFELLIEQGIISNYLVLVDNFNPKKLVTNVGKGLKFLLKNVESPPPVQLDAMKPFLIRNLCTEIWKKADSFCKWNSVFKNCLRKPEVAIDLYNDALSRIKQIIANKSCYEFGDFPSVFKECLPSEIPDCFPCDYKYFPLFCQEDSYFSYISNILKQLELKTLSNWPPKNRKELENILLEYCTDFYDEPMKPFYKVLAIFLKHLDGEDEFKEINNVVWSNVIEIFAIEKVKQMYFSLDNTKYFNKSVFNQLVVIYNPKELETYTNTDWFYVNNPIIKKVIEQNSYSSSNEKKEHLNVSCEEIDEVILKARNKIKDIELPEIRHEWEEFTSLMSDLEESLLINQKISSNMNQKLLDIVQDNP